MSFCGNCGHQLEAGMAVCPSCGTPVSNFTAEASAAVNEAAQNVNAAAGAAADAAQNAAAAGAAAAGAAAQAGFQQQAQGSYSYQQTQGGFQQQAQGGYQQQGYQQQPYQPAPKSVHPIAAGIWAYIFGWIGFIVCIAGADQSNPYVRFHTNQSLVLNLFALICFIPVIGFFWGIFIIVCIIFGLIGASKGEMKEVPLLGKIRILK